MHFDLHYRLDIVNRIKDVVQDIKEWNSEERLDISELDDLVDRVKVFEHCAAPDHEFTIAGSDSSGEFPVASYGDSYVYLVTGLTRVFSSGDEGRLKELDVPGLNLTDLLWLPEDQVVRDQRYDEFFTRLIGIPLLELAQRSDYMELRRQHGGQRGTPDELIEFMVRPPAHDASNIRIHTMTATELCTIARLLRSDFKPTYAISDTTLTLPLVKQKGCIFFELVKRYCCVLAREKETVFMALSKSHNLPHMGQLEDMIEKQCAKDHWFLRLPDQETDGIKPSFLGARGVPPIGGITYIFKLSSGTPPLRVDLDRKFWVENIQDDNPAIQQQREVQIFRDLDFASHDQRCYGYPYPIKASHDIVSLTKPERQALKKHLIDEAEKAGLKRRNFTDTSLFTGHS
jgi:hypothetical protein